MIVPDAMEIRLRGYGHSPPHSHTPHRLVVSGNIINLPAVFSPPVHCYTGVREDPETLNN